MPGGPISSTLWPPAAAISSARLTDLLAFDLGEIHFVVVVVVEDLGDVHLGRRDLDLAFEKADGLAQVLHRDDLQAGDHGGLGGVFRRDQDAGLALRPRAQRDGQHAFDRPHRAGRAPVRRP